MALPQPGRNSSEFSWYTNLLGIALLLVAVGAVTTRAYMLKHTPGNPSQQAVEDYQGFRVFHDDVFFPERAVISGVNPYSTEFAAAYHPEGMEFRALSPTSLLVHAPFGFLQLDVSEIAYLVFNLCLVLMISRGVFQLCGRRAEIGGVAMVAGLMILSRPGLLNFFGMETTLVCIAGCLLAIAFARELPLLAGFGVMLAFCDPVFGLPLVALLLFRGDFRALVLGLVAAIGTSVAVMVYLARDGASFKTVLESVVAKFGGFPGGSDAAEVMGSLTRIDLFSVFPQWIAVDQVPELAAYVTIGGLLFAAACLVLERDAEQRTGLLSRSGLLMLLTILVSMNHHLDHGLMLWMPLAALFLGNRVLDEAFSGFTRGLLVILLLIPMFNFVATQMVVDRTGLDVSSWQWKTAVTINAMAISTATLIVGLRMLMSNVFRPNPGPAVGDANGTS